MNSQLEAYRKRFDSLQIRSRELLSLCPDDRLFESITGFEVVSFGVALIRCAAEVEVVFGGITTRLWDDPFEWTLPEQLSTKSAIFAYFDEVAAMTNRGFAALADDSVLTKIIPAPEQLKPIGEVLQNALNASELNFELAKMGLDLLLPDDRA